MLSGIDVPVRDLNGDIVYDIDGNPYIERVFGLKALGPTLSTNLAPTLAGELAFYGIQRLGEHLGLDPAISQLAGITLSTGSDP